VNSCSDEHLVAIAQVTGDHAAFTELFKRHDKALRGFLCSRVTGQQIEDITQETYIKTFVKIKLFDGKSSFCTWLFSIAINEHRQMIRKSSLLTKFKKLLDIRDSASDLKNLDVFFDFIKLSEILSNNQYDAYVLHTIYGYSHSEIVAKIRLPLGSVKSYIAQADKLLKANA
jgi:RNA polymerase sigma-70 factor (ECF subfamily)